MNDPTRPLTDDLVQAAAAELTTPECPWHDTCTGACEAAQAHARAALNAVRPVLLAETDRLRAENTAQAGRIAEAEGLARNWVGASYEMTSMLDQYLQEDYGTTTIAHCGRAVLTALGLDQDGSAA